MKNIFCKRLLFNFFNGSVLHGPTIRFIIFWDLSMFHQVFLSPQVKPYAIITYKLGIYEFPDELLKDLKLPIHKAHINIPPKERIRSQYPVPHHPPPTQPPPDNTQHPIPPPPANTRNTHAPRMRPRPQSTQDFIARSKITHDLFFCFVFFFFFLRLSLFPYIT